MRSTGESFQRATSEPALSDFCGRFVAESGGTIPFFARHARQTLAAGIAILRLPVHRAELGDTVSGRLIRRTLVRNMVPGLRLGEAGIGVLEIPERVEDYVAGSSKQTLRRKIRAAEKAGITVRPVDDLDERRTVLALCVQAEIDHPDVTYRSAAPEVDDLLDYDLWLVAYGRDDAPLLLSVTPTDGEWAHLRHFRTLGQGDDYSNSRYLMSRALVEALAARGVRHLIDVHHPLRLPNGLRHFQRMVGFRVARVRVLRSPR